MSFWTQVRDAAESVAVVAGNYFVPGSSLITSQLVSKGSQKELGSTFGRLAQLGSGVAGGVGGMGSNWGNIASGDWSALGSSVLGEVAPTATPLVSNAGTTATALTTDAGAAATTPTVAGAQAASDGIAATPADALAPQSADPVAQATDAANKAAGNGPNPQAAPPKAGGITGWVKDNPLPSVLLANTAIAGFGGIGAQSNQRAIEDKRIQAAQDLEAQRRATYAGNSYTGRPGVTTAGTGQLRRADGSLVYGPTGLINS